MSAFSLTQHSRSSHVIGFAMTAAIIAGIAVGCIGQQQSLAEPVSPPQPTTPMQLKAPDVPKAYLPGLGEFMLVIQTHHAKLWHAVRARNWPLAEYQLSEMKEVFSEVQEIVPQYRSVPVGQMIDAITTGPIADLEKAVEEKNFKNFSAAYGKLTASCNDCHKAASRGFIVVRTPARAAFENQDFRPARR